MKVKCSPFLVQIEQLQAVTIARSVVHSNRTWPQWQPPVNVLLAGMASSIASITPSFQQSCGEKHPRLSHHVGWGPGRERRRRGS
jgi:hypothetical protein